MARVICAGHVNWDVTLRVDHLPDPDGEARIESESGDGGGSAANVAAALTGLGQSAAVLGAVGDDERGRAAREKLDAAGVDCTHLVEAPDAKTSVKYLVVDDGGQVMVLGGCGTNESFGAAALPDDALADADHLHLTGQRPATAAELARRATEAGVRVSFDPGRRIVARDFADTLSRSDVLFLNAREAETVLSAGTVDADRQVLVVKRGVDGAEVRAPGGTWSHPGYSVDVLDTTGAGDAFAAGFVASLLEGDDYGRAVAVANATGALAATVVGARPSLSWAAVESLVDGA
ncbi:MAG: carbohydrate kinase family protein [Haloferacaceae archaeon]